MNNTLKNKENNLDKLINAITNEYTAGVVNYLLLYFLNVWASELIIEPKEYDVQIIFRIDWTFHNIISYKKSMHNILVEEIKTMSKIELDEEWFSQRWIICCSFNNWSDADITTTIFPSNSWERVCMIIQSGPERVLKPRELWLRWSWLEKIENILKWKNWCIFIWWEKDSGKTTTWYSLLEYKANKWASVVLIDAYSKLESDKIVKSYSYKWDINSSLYYSAGQLFDMVMVWNINKKETVNKVYKRWNNILTLWILRSNNSFNMLDKFYKVIKNLDDWFFNINTPLLMMSQKLVRRLCENCKEEYDPSEKDINTIKEKLKNIPKSEWLDILGIDNFKLFKAKWCSKCMNTWYKWRMWIFEVLDIDYNLSDKIEKWESNLNELEKNKKKEWFVTMEQDWLIKAIAWYTTTDEVLKD